MKQPDYFDDIEKLSKKRIILKITAKSIVGK